MGGKNGQNNVVTKAREAMGYGVQPSGQPEKSQLTVTASSNAPISVAGIYFNPYVSPQVETSQFLCHDGHCETSVPAITGENLG